MKIVYRKNQIEFEDHYNKNISSSTLDLFKRTSRVLSTGYIEGKFYELYRYEGLYFLIINNKVYNQKDDTN